MVALKRLKCTKSNLKAVNKFEEYTELLQNCLDEEKIEELPEEDKHLGHYLPHRGFLNDNSTTNVRPVFNPLCKSKEGLFLSDCWSKEISMIETIPQIML